MPISYTCPKCSSNDVRESKRKGLLHSLLRIASIVPFRCRNCRIRFYIQNKNDSRDG